MKQVLVGWALVAMVVLAGCGGPGPVPVSGTVTYQGQPVSSVNVTFLGPDGLVAIGTTDAQGQFSKLHPNRPGEGAIPAEYVVTITPKADSPADPSETISYEMAAAPPFPPKYMTMETTDLRATVSAGSDNQFTFELKD